MRKLACGAAGSWFTACGFSAHLVTCGTLNAVVDTGFDSGGRYFYDASGRLVGYQTTYSCQAYDPSFVPLDLPALNRCVPLRSCPVEAGVGDAGAPG